MTGFAYTYLRPAGPIELHIWTQGDRCIQQFSGEEPQTLHIHPAAADAEKCNAKEQAKIDNPRILTASIGPTRHLPAADSPAHPAAAQPPPPADADPPLAPAAEPAARPPSPAAGEDITAEPAEVTHLDQAKDAPAPPHLPPEDTPGAARAGLPADNSGAGPGDPPAAQPPDPAATSRHAPGIDDRSQKVTHEARQGEGRAPAAAPSSAGQLQQPDLTPAQEAGPAAGTIPGQEAVTGSISAAEAPAANGDGELGRAFGDVIEVLASRPGSADTPAAANGRTPAAPAGGDFADISAAFAELRQVLGLPASHDARPAADPPGPAGRQDDIADLRPLDDAMAEARACASWYRNDPEWQRIGAVRQAARALLEAIREAAGSYWNEIRRDIRVRGFFRTVTARAARAISRSACAIAGRLEQTGHRGSRPWQAIWRLHRKAADYADQMMGYLPPGRTLDRVHDVEQIIAALRHTLHGPQPGAAGRPTAPQTPVAARQYAALRRGCDQVARHVRDVGHHPAWRPVARLISETGRLLADTHQGTLAFGADARAIGTMRTVWARTCELAADVAWDLTGQLDRAGRQDTLGWNAARVLHHAARENIAHAYGLLGPGQTTPLGTYSRPGAGPAPGTARLGELIRDPGFPQAFTKVTARRASGRRAPRVPSPPAGRQARQPGTARR